MNAHTEQTAGQTTQKWNDPALWAGVKLAVCKDCKKPHVTRNGLCWVCEETRKPFTICHPDGTETEIPGNSLIAQAYRALETAASKMGKSGFAAHVASKHKKLPFCPSAEHREIIEAMPKLLANEITPEEAMALLHQYETLQQRTAI